MIFIFSGLLFLSLLPPLLELLVSLSLLELKLSLGFLVSCLTLLIIFFFYIFIWRNTIVFIIIAILIFVGAVAMINVTVHIIRIINWKIWVMLRSITFIKITTRRIIVAAIIIRANCLCFLILHSWKWSCFW